MLDVSLNSLVSRLNETCRKALEQAAWLTRQRTNYDIEVEHFLVKLREEEDTDLARILRHFEVNTAHLDRDLAAALERLKRGNTRDTPGISPRIPALLQDAWLVTSLELGSSKIRSGAVVAALVADRESAYLLEEISKEFGAIEAEKLQSSLARIVGGSREDGESAEQAGGSAARTADGKAPLARGEGALAAYTTDLTDRARKGEIDPVLGRDFEIRQAIDILLRRRQNNPILTGEAGVGKTAVVEGLALRIAAGDVPPPLAKVELRVLDLGLLQAGAGVKGEFENRLKGVIQEVKSSPHPVILFIDEAHTMIGAGGQAGQSDAANLLKPALARGELRTLAATTWAEYKKYFEKDPALARRFQVIKVEEPGEEQALVMMRGVAANLEAHHRVRILDEAIEAAVRYSNRYITGRQLPDKAVSVLDTACSRVAMGHSATPAAIEDATRRIERFRTEADILEREAAAGAPHAARLSTLAASLATEDKAKAALLARFEKEKGLVSKTMEIREALEGDVAARRGGEAAKGKKPLEPARAEALRKELGDLRAELAGLQGESPLLRPVVDAETVAEVVSGWTGIPIGKMLADQVRTVLRLREFLGERIVGQDHALEAVSRRIATSRAKLEDPSKPIGVFLLVGPSGVGKTETALALADLLYGGERSLVTINMSEFQEAHTVSSLKGAPPGYVGYGEGGILTEAVRRKPYSVVLLDEVEKAHDDVLEIFYQVFDKGVLEDGEGREIDFKNTVILLTTNLGSDEIVKLCADEATRPESEGLAEALRPALLRKFKPALLARMAVVPYYPLGDEVMKRIVLLKLARVRDRVLANHGAAFTYAEGLVDLIASRCREVQTGARNVDHILTSTLLPELSREVLTRMAEGKAISKVHVAAGADGRFRYEIA